MVVVFLVAASFLAAIFIYHDKSNKQKEVSGRLLNERIDKFDQEAADCKRVIQEIGSESLDKYDKAAQKRLLERQLNCFAEEWDNDKVLKVAEDLKKIYRDEGNEAGIKMIEATVSNISISEKVRENDERNATREPVQ